MSRIICFSIVLFFVSAPTFAQTFVDADATGANDGSTWADAYTDLSDALDGAKSGEQIWVAEGVYTPGRDTASRTSYFRFESNIQLYGGFEGTESELEDRDYENAVTILSGDLNGDDIEDDFNSNKEDNVMHIMWLTDTITSSSLIDGFTFAYGAADDVSGSGDSRRGGGLLSYGTPTIKNCTFTQNFAWFGGGLYPRANANSMLIENCTFHSNSGGSGGGMYLNHRQAEILNCRFLQNRVVNSGGGLYLNATQGASVDDCNFEENVCQDLRGGGAFISNSPSTFLNCIFKSNVAGNSTGGNFHVDHVADEPAVETQFINCTITEGIANWGGGLSAYDLGTNVVLISCEISNNMSFSLGGAFHTGREAESHFFNCIINGNEASASGGALNTQDDSTHVSLLNCTLLNNRASSSGGAINIFSDNDTNAIQPTLKLEDCRLGFNICSTQGGAINMLNGDLEMSGNVIFNNTNQSPTGAGGALSLNGFDSISTTALLVNNTFYGNTSGVGATIGHFTDSLGTHVLTLQNNIFAGSMGGIYEVEGGTPEVVSKGGNLADDGTLAFDLLAENDDIFLDPMFLNPTGGIFELSEGSPCIDTGIDEGAPPLDGNGRQRWDKVDKGALEFQKGSSASQDLEQSIKQITIFPNPVVNSLSTVLENSWNGTVEVILTDVYGREIKRSYSQKTNRKLELTQDVSNLESGYYLVLFQKENLLLSKGFMKQ